MTKPAEFTFLLLLFISIDCMGQFPKQWSITALGGINQLYLEPSGSLFHNVPSPGNYIEFVEGSRGWSSGATISRRLSERWEIESGLVFSEYKYRVRGTVEGSLHSLIEIDAIATDQFFSLPLLFRYYLFRQKNLYYLSTGLLADYEFGLNRCNPSHRFSLGAVLQLFSNYSLQVEPTFQYALTSYREYIHQDGAYHYRPSVLSLLLGIRKSF